MRGFPLGVEFTAESVAAMLAGLKTQTRRAAVSESGRANPLCKLEPGDQVYVREPISWHPGLAEPVYDGAPFYLENEAVNLGRKPENWEPRGDRTRARFMPKWAGRLIATVRSVRIEPVRAITDEDALAEGIVNAFFVNGWMDACAVPGYRARRLLRALWPVHRPVRRAAPRPCGSAPAKPGARLRRPVEPAAPQARPALRR